MSIHEVGELLPFLVSALLQRARGHSLYRLNSWCRVRGQQWKPSPGTEL